jgi:WD40 repeat protein
MATRQRRARTTCATPPARDSALLTMLADTEWSMASILTNKASSLDTNTRSFVSPFTRCPSPLSHPRLTSLCSLCCGLCYQDGELVATGESAEIPRLIVWSTVTNAIHFSEKSAPPSSLPILPDISFPTSASVSICRGFHRNGIIHTAFSADGKQLASVGLDLFHSVAVHLWRDKQLLYTCQVDKGKCLSCFFLPENHTLVIGGDSYLYLWRSPYLLPLSSLPFCLSQQRQRGLREEKI